MTTQNLADWADQYRAELEQLAANRAATLEPLLRAGDFEACRDWLDEWASEDREPDSLASRYRQTLSRIKRDRIFAAARLRLH